MPKASAPPVEFLCAEFYLRCPIFLKNAGFCLCFGKMGMGLFTHSWVRSILFIKKQNGQAKTCPFCFLAEDTVFDPCKPHKRWTFEIQNQRNPIYPICS